MRLRCLALALCFVFAFNASAEWYDDYQQGVDMFKKRNWKAAIANLKSAIEQKDEEAAIVNLYEKTYGDYYPHYYLAMAHFYAEQYREAIAEFDKSAGFGAIQKNPELYQKMKDLRSLATAQLAVREPAKPEVAISTQAPKTTAAQSVQTAPQTMQSEVPAETDKNQEARESIRAAARKYFEGHFEETIALLSGLLRAERERAAAQFLLGCAYASKYLLSGSQDGELFKKASAAFQNAKRIDPDFPATQNPYISPAILHIYKQS